MARQPASTAAESKTKRLLAAAHRQGTRTERDNELYMAIEALTAEAWMKNLASGAERTAAVGALAGIQATQAHENVDTVAGRCRSQCSASGHRCQSHQVQPAGLSVMLTANHVFYSAH